MFMVLICMKSVLLCMNHIGRPPRIVEATKRQVLTDHENSLLLIAAPRKACYLEGPSSLCGIQEMEASVG